MRLKLGDTVVVLSGRDRGKSGKIISVQPKAQTVVVDGINRVIKHRKPTTANAVGGKFEEFAPIASSKIGIAHPTKKGKATRVGFKIDAKNKKTRVYKSNGKEI